jgi:voltage-gated potassium channel
MSAPITETQITFFQLLLLILSVVVLAALLFGAVTTLPAEAARIIQLLDTAVCVLFFLDFAIRFRAAERKLLFLKWGWIDLIASIPNVDILRWGRLLRIIHVIRVLRAIRSFQRILSIILHHRTRNGAASVLVTFVLLVVFTSVGILVCETSPNANILSAEDAIWWSVSTITTVGYGDKFPVTTEGRIIAMALMIAGVGLFGTLSGIIASHLLGAGAHSEETSQQVLIELRELRARVDDLANRKKAAPKDSDSADG